MNTPDTEKAILGGMITDGDRVISRCVEVGMAPSWFDNEDRGTIYQAIVDMWAGGRAVDYTRTADTLRISHHEDLVACLEAFIDCYHGQGFVEEYLDDLSNSYKMRKFTQTLHSLIGRVDQDPLRPADEWIAEAQDRISKIEVDKCCTQELHEVAKSILDKCDSPQKRGLQWPLDKMTNFWGPLTDEYVILGSQPSIGKTAFALNLAVCLAHGGHRVAFASLESSVEKVVQRLISIIADVNFLRLKHGKAEDDEKAEARHAERILKDLPLSVIHHRMTLEMMMAWGKKEKARGAEMLILDNTRHIRPSKKYQSRVDQFADTSVHGKWLRDDTELPVMFLHHTNDEDRLSWSRDFERDADIIVCMTQDKGRSILPTELNNYAEKCIVTLDAVKNRDGVRGPVSCEFIKPKQRFE